MSYSGSQTIILVDTNLLYIYTGLTSSWSLDLISDHCTVLGVGFACRAQSVTWKRFPIPSSNTVGDVNRGFTGDSSEIRVVIIAVKLVEQSESENQVELWFPQRCDLQLKKRGTDHTSECDRYLISQQPRNVSVAEKWRRRKHVTWCDFKLIKC